MYCSTQYVWKLIHRQSKAHQDDLSAQKANRTHRDASSPLIKKTF